MTTEKTQKDLLLNPISTEQELIEHDGQPLQSGTTSDLHDENTERGNWNHKADFILSLLGYAVGLSNIWRFPYLCYRNGGGAFLIPYWIFNFLAGVPLFLLEVSIGQFTSRSAVSMWSICPLLKGAGYATVIVTLVVSTYYNMVMAYVVFFFFNSFTLGKLPWATCDNAWNTPNCLDFNNETLRTMYTDYHNWKDNPNNPNYTHGESYSDMFANRSVRSGADEYFHNRVLQISDGLEKPGKIVWELVVCIIPVWILIILSLHKGVKSAGKVVYFTATFPYLVLTILLVRGVTLPGAMKGLYFYIVPQWERLLDPQVWLDAAFQIFYSLGPGWGGLVTMGSYNRLSNNCYRDGLIIPIVNGLSSLYAGFVVFSVAGFMAETLGRPVGEVVEQGPGFAFIMYPEVVTKLPISPLWSACFFLMLFTVGFDSEFVMIETAISTVWDELPSKYKIKRYWILLGACLIMFILELPLMTQGGMFVFQLFDAYCASFTVAAVCLCELLAISWIYGAERFLDDIRFMIGYRPAPVLWSFAWRISCTGIIMAICIVAVIRYTPLEVYNGYKYPEWSKGIGWFLILISLLWIPGGVIVQFIRAKGSTFMQKLRNSLRPSEEWGPALSRHRAEYEVYKKHPLYGRGLLYRKRNKNSHDPMLKRQDSSRC